MSDQVLIDTLIIEICCVCSVEFGMTKKLKDERLNDGRNFYCPNGHQQHYTESMTAKLKRAREDKEWWEGEANRVGRSLVSTRGVVTKLKNRSHLGTCIYCEKKFPDLAQHMDICHHEHMLKEQNA